MDEIKYNKLDKQLFFLIHFLKEKHLLKDWIYDITNKNNMFLTFNKNKHISFYCYKNYLLYLKSNKKYSNFFENDDSFLLLDYAQFFYSWSMDEKKSYFWQNTNDKATKLFKIIFK